MIKLELTPHQVDLIFFALQNTPLPAGVFNDVKELIDVINDQGQPQLQALAVQKTEEKPAE